MGVFDRFSKKAVPCETGGKLLLSLVIDRSEFFLSEVIPDISKDLNLDLNVYDKNILRTEAIFICLWAATKALDGDKHKLIDSIYNAFFGVFGDNKAGELRAVFIDRCNQYNKAWDDSSGGNQSILALKILSEIFCGGELDRRLSNASALFSIITFVFLTMESVLKVRSQIRLTDE